MRCPTCGYVLWNLAPGPCPECGTEFLPSKCRFRPHAVRYCCPHCDEAYHGTDADGRLDPRAFVCVRCEQPIEMDQMILRPEPGHESEGTIGGSMPWLEGTGIVVPWFLTVGKAMTAPQEVIRGVPERAPIGPAFLFMAATLGLYVLIGNILPQSCAVGILGAGFQGGAPGSTMLLGLGQSVGGLIAMIVGSLVWIAIAHALIRLLGGTAELARSAHCILYSSAAALGMAIPCGCIGVVGMIWWIVSATIMMSAVHRVSGFRASMAVVGPFIAMLGVGVTTLVLLLASPMGPGMWMGGGAGLGLNMGTVRSADAQVAHLRDALVGRMNDTGTMPGHVVSLVGSGLGLLDLESYRSVGVHGLGATSVGGVPLSQLVFDPNGVAAQQARSAAEAESFIAYQIGEFVFTHAGIRAGDPPDLWVVISMPSVPATASPAPLQGADDDLIVALLGGGTARIVPEEVDAAIDAQNVLRRGVGLAPLPAGLRPLPWRQADVDAAGGAGE